MKPLSLFLLEKEATVIRKFHSPCSFWKSNMIRYYENHHGLERLYGITFLPTKERNGMKTLSLPYHQKKYGERRLYSYID